MGFGATCLTAGLAILSPGSNAQLRWIIVGWTLVVIGVLCVSGAWKAWYRSEDDATRSHTQLRFTSGAKSVRQRTRRWIAAATAAIVAAVVLVCWQYVLEAPVHYLPDARVQNLALPGSVAVLSFRNDSNRPDLDWLSIAIADMFAANVALREHVIVVPREDVVRMQADLGLEAVDRVPALSFRRVQRNLHVESLMTGSIRPIGDSGLWQVEFQIVKAGRRGTRTGGATGTLFGLVSSAMRGAGFDELSDDERRSAEAQFPNSAQALEFYTKGLALLGHGDARRARDLLILAAHAEPEFPLAHSALSAAESMLGNDSEAIVEAGKAVELSGRLPEEQKRQLQARRYAARHDLSKVVESKQALSLSFPKSLQYGLELVTAQIVNFQDNEALKTLKILRQTLPEPLSDDMRLDLLESKAYEALSDAGKQREFAIKAASAARKVGARSLLARARLLEGHARQGKDAEAAAIEAQTLYEALGDSGGKALAIELLAKTRDGVDYNDELQLLNEALGIHEELGDKVSAARVLVNIGTTLVWLGDSDEAAMKFDESLRIFRNVGDKYSEAASQNDIGTRMFSIGKLDAAADRYKQALGIFENIPDSGSAAAAKGNLAEVLEWRGDLDNARTLFGEVLVYDRNSNDNDAIAYDHFRLGEIFSLKGDISEARTRYQEALDWWTAAGKTASAAEAHVALASLAIEQGRAAVVELGLGNAEAILRDSGEPDRALLSLGLLAECLLAQGKQVEASAVAKSMATLKKSSKNPGVRLALATIEARVQAATRTPDDVAKALQSLEMTRAEASRAHFVISELEARLASGEIELAAGRPEARTHLRDLATVAQAKGFGRIARLARVAL